MRFIGQLASTNLTAATGLIVSWNFWSEFYGDFIVKNPSQRANSSSERTRQYLRRLDNKTMMELIEVYQIDFEMFKYSPEGYYNIV